MVIVQLYMILWSIILIATHVGLTILVYKDSQNIKDPLLGIYPILWLGIAFTLPVIGMFIYWIMNYSSLSKRIA